MKTQRQLQILVGAWKKHRSSVGLEPKSAQSSGQCSSATAGSDSQASGKMAGRTPQLAPWAPACTQPLLQDALHANSYARSGWCNEPCSMQSMGHGQMPARYFECN
mmetsp:Transcript_30554/g.54283  ORF Transcript_30554/g.54283 Transcript_30554/m.54283 type:complete len:106 (+) Transcript_30554:709-1026(+)